MAKVVTAYCDGKGNLHTSAEAAAKSDLAALIGATAEGMSVGLANLLFQKREELEQIFKDYDDMTDPRIGIG